MGDRKTFNFTGSRVLNFKTIISRIKEGSGSYLIYSLEGLIIGDWVFLEFGSSGYQWYN